MAVLPIDEMHHLLLPYLLKEEDLAQPERARLLDQLSTYLDLLVRWNERMNLTAIRDPRQIVSRHFGESLFVAQHLPSGGSTLDLGSGAGFPGIPIQLWHPGTMVMLAESQAKKATFLREVVRSLALATEVWSQRAELLAGRLRFDTVVLRAVDDLERAIAAAFSVTAGDVWLLGSAKSVKSLPSGVKAVSTTALPGRTDSWLFRLR